MGFFDSVPESIQAIMQDGLLERVFQDALVPAFLYNNLAADRPWGAHIGDTSIMTRNGLMEVDDVPAPITGHDADVGNYGTERYTMTMDQFGKSIDTNMAVSAMALASKFINDNKILAIHAAQTTNRLARNALYAKYGTGTTYVTASSSSSTTLVVEDARGFDFAVANLPTTNGNSGEGLAANTTPTLVPVSGSNALAITVNGSANTVTGVDVATNTLTLSSAISATPGQAVISSIGPVQYRPNARASRNDLISSDIATLSLFQSAVTRLRRSNVPRLNGAYTAHITPETLDELFQDDKFTRAYATRADSPAYRDFTLGSDIGDEGEFVGRFLGIDWVLNNETPQQTNIADLTVFQPIVCGAEVLIRGPFEGMADLIEARNAGSTVQIDYIDGVARILRAPQDRLGQILSSTWSWIGGYAVGTDLLTGDAASFKRAVVVEHV